MDSFLDAADFVARDVSGIFVAQDVNLTLQKRDVLLGTLDSTYSRHATDLRSSDFVSSDILPGVGSVLTDSGADVTRALLKKVTQTPDGRPARDSYSSKKPFQERGKADKSSSRSQYDRSFRFDDRRQDDRGRRDEYRPRGRGRGHGDNRQQSSYNNDDRRQQPQQQRQQQQQRGRK
jgi:hypothetical protein